MENRKLYCHIVFSSALLISLISAKTFSLNEALASESKIKSDIDTVPPSHQTEKTAQRFSLNNALSPDPLNKFRNLKSGISGSTGKLANLKIIKNKHRVTDSLRTTKLKSLLKPLQIRKKSSKKRETLHHNDKINRKYFPILKNLGLLLDNLLNSEPIDSYEVTKSKFKRHKNPSERKRAIVCKCGLQSDAETGESKSYKKTTLISKTISTEIPFTATSAPYTPIGDLSSDGQDKDISLLLPRDPVSNRRDSDGYGEGSSATLHRSLQRNFAGNLRNRKYHTELAERQLSAESYEENTYSDSRNNAGSDEYRRGPYRRGDADYRERNTSTQNSNHAKNKETNDVVRGDIFELPRETKLKNRRNETKSNEFIPKYIRLRRPISKKKNSNVVRILSQENDEKSVVYDALNKPSDKRVIDRSSSDSAENKKNYDGNQTLISIKDLSDVDLALQKSSNNKVPLVTIIDGYSVARDKNGQNKLTEKAIHIHT